MAECHDFMCIFLHLSCNVLFLEVCLQDFYHKFPPQSVSILEGQPYCIMISLYMNSATTLTVASGTAFAIGQLVAWSIAVMIHLLPLTVLGRIPMKSRA